MLKFNYILFSYFLFTAGIWFALKDPLSALCVSVLITVVFIMIIAWGVADIRSRMFIDSFNGNPLAKDRIAITFDDGPDEKNTRELLKILKKHNVKATFFLIGQKIKKKNEIVRDIFSEGHQISNHSCYHKNSFPLLSFAKMKDEIICTQKAIKEITGNDNRFFRPPFGVTNPTVAKAVKFTGLKVAGWSIRTFDTKRSLSKEKILSRVLIKLKPGDIVLLHDTGKNVLWLTDNILKYTGDKGWAAVTVEELSENNV